MHYDDKVKHAKRLARQHLESFELLSIWEDDELSYEDGADQEEVHRMITEGTLDIV